MQGRGLWHTDWAHFATSWSELHLCPDTPGYNTASDTATVFELALLQDINTVRKRKSYGLPNAIEVEYGGQTDLYTSFLNRKEAYRQIVAAWGSSW